MLVFSNIAQLDLDLPGPFPKLLPHLHQRLRMRDRYRLNADFSVHRLAAFKTGKLLLSHLYPLTNLLQLPANRVSFVSVTFILLLQPAQCNLLAMRIGLKPGQMLRQLTSPPFNLGALPALKVPSLALVALKLLPSHLHLLT
jgi:hypothetical protein